MNGFHEAIKTFLIRKGGKKNTQVLFAFLVTVSMKIAAWPKNLKIKEGDLMWLLLLTYVGVYTFVDCVFYADSMAVVLGTVFPAKC